MENSLIVTDILPADQHPAYVYLASLGKGSVPAQRSALNAIAAIFKTNLTRMNWGALRYQHVQFIRARLQEAYDPATANRLLTALRRVTHNAWKMGQMPDEEYRKIADVERIRGSKDEVELEGRALKMGEISALMNACARDKTIAGTRDAAIIALGYGLGLRRAEISKMNIEDYDRADHLITIRSGKGNKSRTLPIDDGARFALEDWLKIRGTSSGSMFFGINKAGKFHEDKSLGVKGVAELYQKRCAQADVEDTGFHDLRRSFVSDLLERDVELVTVSKLAGHSDPRTTAKYDRRNMETRRKAIQTLHVPYRRPKQ